MHAYLCIHVHVYIYIFIYIYIYTYYIYKLIHMLSYIERSLYTDTDPSIQTKPSFKICTEFEGYL